jgi:hypothetical protein
VSNASRPENLAGLGSKNFAYLKILWFVMLLSL